LRAAGDTDTPRTPCATSRLAMKPDALASSMNSPM
jgi:hypothetical protein